MKSEREINHSHDSRDVDNRPLEEQCRYLEARVEALTERVKQLEEELQRLSRE